MSKDRFRGELPGVPGLEDGLAKGRFIFEYRINARGQVEIVKLWRKVPWHKWWLWPKKFLLYLSQREVSIVHTIDAVDSVEMIPQQPVSLKDFEFNRPQENIMKGIGDGEPEH